MGYPIGVQSFTYRSFSLDELPSTLSSTPVTAIELCDVHLTPAASEHEITTTVKSFADVGIDVCGYGVVDVDADTALDPLFTFADRLGAEYLSVNVSPAADDQIRDLLAAAEKWETPLALHNHGPESYYSTVEEVLDVLDRYESPWLGACVDTGHYLRAGQDIDEVIPALGDRVHAIHLTDFDDDGDEVVPGTGRTDLGSLVALLEEHTTFDQPLVIEYESDPDDPTPAVVETAEALTQLDADEA